MASHAVLDRRLAPAGLIFFSFPLHAAGKPDDGKPGAWNHRELALGTNGRSGDQWDVWQSVYSPVGADGYPKPIWDKRTGRIDNKVSLRPWLAWQKPCM